MEPLDFELTPPPGDAPPPRAARPVARVTMGEPPAARVLHGDCLEVLPTLPAGSIDAVVTDPPYGLGFMGREWDTFAPRPGTPRRRAPGALEGAALISANPNLHGRHRSPALSPSQIAYDYSAAGVRHYQAWSEAWGREVLRVLKPGGYAVVCGAPRTYHRLAAGLEDAGFEIRDCLAWLFGSGFPKSHNLGDGRGTALKPAHEPIVLARKPFDGTVIDNVHRHGTGALNIDACRIGSDDTRRIKEGWRGQFPHEDDTWTSKTVTVGSDQGRWPANVVLDDVAAAELDEQSGDLVSGGGPTWRGAAPGSKMYGFLGQQACPAPRGQDSGGASRFYYVAKPSQAERDSGLPLAGNAHPTVKPVALMRWLVRLITPIGGIVLDPFLGSGTTGIACRCEHRGFVGIEREAAFLALAEQRMRHVAPCSRAPSKRWPRLISSSRRRRSRRGRDPVEAGRPWLARSG